MSVNALLQHNCIAGGYTRGLYIVTNILQGKFPGDMALYLPKSLCDLLITKRQNNFKRTVAFQNFFPFNDLEGMLRLKDFTCVHCTA